VAKIGPVADSVLIVGAGVIGTAVACELTARGVACTVVDERDPGGGATQASAGMLAPYVEAHEQGPLLDLGIRSLALYDDWIARVAGDAGLDVEYRRLGTLEIALDAHHASELRATAACGVGVTRTWLEPADARANHPALGTITGALFTPAHGYVSARQLTAAQAAAAVKGGAQFHRARATRIERDGDAARVITSTGPLTAPSVVLAAGAWGADIDIEGAAVPPLRPVRGQLLHLGWRARPIETIIWGPECYIVPRIDGSLLVGATVEDVGFDERATSAGVRDLLDAACDLLPGGWGATFLGVFVGLRPATPDDLPVLGPDARMPGLVHASGHYRNGVLLAPLTARLVADWIVDGRHDPAFDVLNAGRFFRGI
jgi:glycine oxidase